MEKSQLKQKQQKLLIENENSILENIKDRKKKLKDVTSEVKNNNVYNNILNNNNPISKLIQNIKKSNKIAKILTTTSFSDIIQVNKWWEQVVEDDSETKWTKLEHNGIVVAPRYEPHGVKILYKGNPIELKPFQEEIATFWAGLLNNDLSTKKITRNNFIKEFKNVLDSSYKDAILEDFDFTPIVQQIESVRERNKNRTVEEKKVRILIHLYYYSK